MKTWTGRTITVVIDPERVTKNVKREIAAKTGVPIENQQLVTRAKALTDNVPMKEYGLSGGETIEMTAKLLAGMKKKSFSPKPMDTKREKGKIRNRVSTWETASKKIMPKLTLTSIHQITRNGWRTRWKN